MARAPNLASARAEAKRQSQSFTSFPIDPFQIAQDNDIQVIAGDSNQPGISGCIMFSGDGVAIYYSRAIDSIGFQRFTVAHELGHYFIEGHPEEIDRDGGRHVSRTPFESTQAIEKEADAFAAHLLMPTLLSREVLLSAPRGLQGISALSTAAITSLTSAAIRAVEIDPYPMAVIKSRNGKVQFSTLTDKLKSCGRFRSYAKDMPLPEVDTPEDCLLSDWFDVAPSGIKARGETVSLGQYGTLTVITLQSDIIDPYEDIDEEAEEETALEESWKVRFKGQR